MAIINPTAICAPAGRESPRTIAVLSEILNSAKRPLSSVRYSAFVFFVIVYLRVPYRARGDGWGIEIRLLPLAFTDTFARSFVTDIKLTPA